MNILRATLVVAALGLAQPAVANSFEDLYGPAMPLLSESTFSGNMLQHESEVLTPAGIMEQSAFESQYHAYLAVEPAAGEEAPAVALPESVAGAAEAEEAEVPTHTSTFTPAPLPPVPTSPTEVPESGLPPVIYQNSPYPSLDSEPQTTQELPMSLSPMVMPQQ